ncbi:PREDICTED: olfactory receptor 6B1-like [Nanorana parkeri]|uniref:olfactory receptor 6B1-like n=1 Tax=Nanorana parkeri TaxID=125878 RepID=UPI000854244D|nr:PREDICTED: olfactory receptor 6B1-like [Nanorana parkeri]
MANQSGVTEFFLLGFPGLPEKYNAIPSSIMFLVYILSLCANSTVLCLVIVKETLHVPMYILVGYLALSDLISDVATLPKIIARYWFQAGSISFSACFFQMFLFHYLNSLDSLIIMLMAFDRFVAICKPLQYQTIVTTKLVFSLSFIVTLLAASVGIYCVRCGLVLSYCGPNKIRNIFCAVTSVSVLSCMDSLPIREEMSFLAIGIHMVPLGFIAFSYAIVISKLCTAVRSEGWRKAFYTCTTHWFVITLHFIPRVVVYSYNRAQLIPNADVNILLICLYTYIPHVSSPIIFCLRTEEIKRVMGKVIGNFRNVIMTPGVYK